MQLGTRKMCPTGKNIGEECRTCLAAHTDLCVSLSHMLCLLALACCRGGAAGGGWEPGGSLVSFLWTYACFTYIRECSCAGTLLSVMAKPESLMCVLPGPAQNPASLPQAAAAC
jgi:hypothetical protein